MPRRTVNARNSVRLQPRPERGGRSPSTSAPPTLVLKPLVSAAASECAAIDSTRSPVAGCGYAAFVAHVGPANTVNAGSTNPCAWTSTRRCHGAPLPLFRSTVNSELPFP